MRRKIEKLLADDVVTSERAAKLLNVSDGWIRQLIIAKRLKAVKMGKTWLIDIHDLERLKKETE